MENYLMQQFTNELFGSVRTILDQYGNPWFVGRDVATALGYTNTNNALKDHVDPRDRWGSETIPHPAPTIIDNLGRPQTPVWINESGLYSLIFGSKLPAAVEFKYWVTSEVLPTMRQLGFNRAVASMRNTIDVLSRSNQVASSIAMNNTSLKMDYNILAYNVINNPNISLNDKINMFSYDPTVVNPEVDLEASITQFLNSNI